MDYSANPWWLYAITIVVVFGIVIGLPLWGVIASSRRARRQSVVIEDGVVSVTDAALGGRKAIPAERIGTVVYLAPMEHGVAVAPVTSLALATSNTPQGEDYHKTQGRALGSGTDMFRHGGLIILDTDGRMVGHVAYEVGSRAPLATVWKQIPAQNYVQAPLNKAGTAYSRSAFKRAYPKALRVGNLWSGPRWFWTIVGFVLVGIPLAAFLTVFVMAFVRAWGDGGR